MKIKCKVCGTKLDLNFIGAQWHYLWAHKEDIK